MDYKVLKFDCQESIGIITLNRPDAMNALNSTFFAEMSSMLDDIANDNSVKIVIITGEGKAFAAGADIAEMSKMSEEQGFDFSQVGQNVFNKIENFKLPVIAAVNGFALGGGCELTMSCDMRIASTKAKFGQPEVNLGLIPGYSGTQRLARLCGAGNALYLICSAEMIDSNEALRIGLVQRVYEPEILMEKVKELAKNIISKGNIAVQTSKKVIRQGLANNFECGSNLESECFGKLFGTKETTEGMNAFLEKRKPNW
ncbi:MAG: hypothetical protein A2046_06385 [Bacteroidetes bacterium GWA2_30_7]|nr:MAG: hypothetical protein A2046_06385 [Bacteroidetes bacterium GWA2_30_7]